MYLYLLEHQFIYALYTRFSTFLMRLLLYNCFTTNPRINIVYVYLLETFLYFIYLFFYMFAHTWSARRHRRTTLPRSVLPGIECNVEKTVNITHSLVFNKITR